MWQPPSNHLKQPINALATNQNTLETHLAMP